jgi:8-oxo-dGTP diphosphatase
MIEIVVALIMDGPGRVLLVRKRGTRAFMQPGGKREAGEGDLEALGRELKEEIGCGIVWESVRPLGVFEAPAAHEPGRIVRAALYAVEPCGPMACRAEIAEMLWVDPQAPGGTLLAPLTRDAVLPIAISLHAGGFHPAGPGPAQAR